MRKRRAVSPRLESMEERLTLSGLAAATPTAEVHVTRLSRIEAHKAREATSRATKDLVVSKDHHAITHAKTGKATATPTSFSSAISSFFKSAFGGL